MSQEFANTAGLLPQSLDDIIRLNRAQAELRLSRTNEIDALVGTVDNYVGVKDGIDNWRLVSFIDKPNKSTRVMLIGDSTSRKHPTITSPLAKIDLARGVAKTVNGSVYKLGNRGYGEPSRDGLAFLCAAMHRWGNGRTLGVPRF
ncbi:MAG TPA: hypothetical protein VF798_06535 [Burkholderiaceae bacterium]